MKIRKMITTASLGLLFAGALPATIYAREDTGEKRIEVKNVEEQGYKGIVQVQASKGDEKDDYGTGFLIAPNLLLTNKHVTGYDAKEPEATYVDYQGKRIEIESVTHLGEEHDDLAVVKLKEAITDVEPYQLAPFEEIEKIDVKEQVKTVGYPGDKPYGSMWEAEGAIVEKMGNVIVFEGNVSPGNSGSPIFNGKGEVIGLTNASSDEENKAIGFLFTEELYQGVKQLIDAQ